MDYRAHMLESANRYWSDKSPASLDDFIYLKGVAANKARDLIKRSRDADNAGNSDNAYKLRREAEPWQQKDRQFLAALGLLSLSKMVFDTVYKPPRDLPTLQFEDNSSISGDVTAGFARAIANQLLLKELSYIYNPTCLEEYNEAADALAKETLDAYVTNVTMSTVERLSSNESSDAM